MKAQVMTRAWEIAKAAVKEFGGKAKQYISEALKMAWAEVKKAGKVIVAELIGSEKQIAWAEDIRNRYIKMFSEEIEEEVYFNGVWSSAVLGKLYGSSFSLCRVFDIAESTGRTVKEVSKEMWEKTLATKNEARFWINHR